MHLDTLIKHVRKSASSWGEILEPCATQEELRNVNIRLQSISSISLPTEYSEFLGKVNGLDFNGLILYGTKNSEIDSESSPLDIVEMNGVFKGAAFDSLQEVLILGESSTGILVYDAKSEEYQFRDRIGVSRISYCQSFLDMFRFEVEKVSNEEWT